RNCRERWRTIRSSFLRSLKLSRTSTGRGKRKYYLSKYLQFLIPFTKTRLKNSASIIAQRKAAATGNIPPMTRISNMPIVSSDDTKDSTNSGDVAAIAEGDVVVSLHEGAVVGGISITQHAPLPLPQPLNLQAIKQEKDVVSSGAAISTSSTATNLVNCNTAVVTLAANAQRPFLNSTMASCLPNNNNNSMNSCNNNFNAVANAPPSINKIPVNNPSQCNATFSHPPHQDARNSDASAMDLADWLKSRSDHPRHYRLTPSPDADQSFLNSLHPYLKEMTGKQNRRFRQKVVALIDAILDNAD
uniref:BESS domain-containing protein n=1 Tax=Stomoxys calcitrans TaxID=35570 RepID=A0A1I8QAZ2_STOCA